MPPISGSGGYVHRHPGERRSDVPAFCSGPSLLVVSGVFRLWWSARLCLRQRAGVYFIMITPRLRPDDLLRGSRSGSIRYGGDDRTHHLSAQPVRRPDRPFEQGAVSTTCGSPLLIAAIYLTWRLANFALRGLVLQGSRSERDAHSARSVLRPFRYRLAGFVDRRHDLRAWRAHCSPTIPISSAPR